jgi:hypothetical protein
MSFVRRAHGVVPSHYSYAHHLGLPPTLKEHQEKLVFNPRQTGE